MRGHSSAHKGVERASGPKATCEITNDDTLETSKCLDLPTVFSIKRAMQILVRYSVDYRTFRIKLSY